MMAKMSQEDLVDSIELVDVSSEDEQEVGLTEIVNRMVDGLKNDPKKLSSLSNVINSVNEDNSGKHN